MFPSKKHHWLPLILFLVLPISIPAQTNVNATISPEPPIAQATPPPAHPSPPTKAGGIEVLRDIVIGKGGTQDLHADIAYPKAPATPLPAIIRIHGGGWSKGTYKTSSLAQFAMNGYFIASIEYRLSNVAKWPAQIQDCKLAVRWLRANAVKYNVDPNRIGVWGESAGGHLVACLGTMTDAKYEGDGGYPGVSSSVQAVVDLYGPTDFTHPAGFRTLAEGLFGVPYATNPELWKSGSPLFAVKPGDPPMLLAHGDTDVVVPLAQSTVFDEALTKAGVAHEFLVVKNAGHSFSPKPGATIDPSFQDIQKIITAFFDKYLKAH